MKFQTYVDSLTAAQKAREKFYERKKLQDAIKSNADMNIETAKDEMVYTDVSG